MKTILCSLFGHTIQPNTYADKYTGGETDGIGRIHMTFQFQCQRCHQPVALNTHLPQSVKLQVENDLADRVIANTKQADKVNFLGVRWDRVGKA